jgi:hypothetical protein
MRYSSALLTWIPVGIHTLATLLLRKVPPTEQRSCGNYVAMVWIETLLTGSQVVKHWTLFFVTGMGRSCFVVVIYMCNRWQDSCVETVLPQHQVGLITTESSGCENVLREKWRRDNIHTISLSRSIESVVKNSWTWNLSKEIKKHTSKTE